MTSAQRACKTTLFELILPILQGTEKTRTVNVDLVGTIMWTSLAVPDKRTDPVNTTEAWANLSAKSFKTLSSGWRRSWFGPALHLFDLKAAGRSLRMLNLSVYSVACSAGLS